MTGAVMKNFFCPLSSFLVKLVSCLIIVFVILLEIYFNIYPSSQGLTWRFLSVYCGRILWALSIFVRLAILGIFGEGVVKVFQMIRRKEEHSIYEVVDAVNKMLIPCVMLAVTPFVLWMLGFDNTQAHLHYIFFMIIAVGIINFKTIGRTTFLLVSTYLIATNGYDWLMGFQYFGQSDAVTLVVLILLNGYLFTPSVSRLFKNLT